LYGSNRYRLELFVLPAQCEQPVARLAGQVNHPAGNPSQPFQALGEVHPVKACKEGLQIFYRLADQSVLNLLREMQSLAWRQLAEVDKTVRLL
jgi:ArsR family transcriptional regulator